MSIKKNTLIFFEIISIMIIIIWMVLTMFIFNEVFYRVPKINAQYFSLLTYWMIIPISTTLAYNSYSFLVNKKKVATQLTSIIISIFLFILMIILPILIINIGLLLKEKYMIPFTISQPILAIIFLITLVTSTYLFNKKRK